MTGNATTFRQGVTAYRNAPDWAKEERDRAIKDTNNRASPSRKKALNADESSGVISSFTTEISASETNTPSQTSQVDDSQTISHPHPSQPLTDGDCVE